MYNRYIRNEQGTYTRIREEEPGRTNSAPPPPKEAPPPPPPPPNGGSPAGRIADSLTSFLRHTLDQLHLNSVDTGDLLLLGLLFFLFREDADEELLVALGLLLIL